MPDTAAGPDLALLALLDPDGHFLARLVQDLRTIKVLRRSLALGGGAGQSARIELVQLAHRLAGAAGTFGFAEISAVAIEVEDILIEGRASSINCVALDAATEGLERALTAASAIAN